MPRRSSSAFGQFQPFADEQAMRTRPDGHKMVVWKRESGETIGSLTLRPSFLVGPSNGTIPSTGQQVKCGGVHGYVTAGHWEDC